jgi:hypothetical protein
MRILAVCEGRHKLILGRCQRAEQISVKPGDLPRELFDQATDPGEWANLRSDRAEIVSRVTALLEKEGESRVL